MLIKNGRIIDPANGIDEINDLLIEDGRIVKVGKVEFIAPCEGVVMGV